MEQAMGIRGSYALIGGVVLYSIGAALLTASFLPPFRDSVCVATCFHNPNVPMLFSGVLSAGAGAYLFAIGLYRSAPADRVVEGPPDPRD